MQKNVILICENLLLLIEQQERGTAGKMRSGLSYIQWFILAAMGS
ncbi:hypothetical protein RV11_GL001407 [Enterococcus phoeniculicola]|nr:hypothetical protein RV11_GL001407 [Enterococcus phoeniculicola]